MEGKGSSSDGRSRTVVKDGLTWVKEGSVERGIWNPPTSCSKGDPSLGCWCGGSGPRGRQ